MNKRLGPRRMSEVMALACQIANSLSAYADVLENIDLADVNPDEEYSMMVVDLKIVVDYIVGAINVDDEVDIGREEFEAWLQREDSVFEDYFNY